MLLISRDARMYRSVSSTLLHVMTNVERPLSQLWRIQGAEYRMSHAGTLRPAELRLALTADEPHRPTRSAS